MRDATDAAHNATAEPLSPWRLALAACPGGLASDTVPEVAWARTPDAISVRALRVDRDGVGRDSARPQR